MHRVLPLLASVFLACALTACRKRMTSVAISDALITVGPDWVEFPLREPLIAEWQNQVVLVAVTTKFEPSVNPLGLRLENGNLFTPEMDAITKEAAHRELRLQWFRNSNQIAFENDVIPTSTRIVGLRMRSPVPLVISSVAWISYAPADTKTGYP